MSLNFNYLSDIYIFIIRNSLFVIWNGQIHGGEDLNGEARKAIMQEIGLLMLLSEYDYIAVNFVCI